MHATTGTESAERVADVLLSFTRTDDPLGVSSIARQLDLSKAVVHRILQSLVSRKLVQYSSESRDYRLGSAAAALGAHALRQLDIRSVARLPLMDLRDATGETTTLSLLSADKRIYIDQYESPNEVKMTVELGRIHPLHAGASSRAILAHLPPEFIARVAGERLVQTTAHTITDAKHLLKSLDLVRELGYSRSFGERQADAGSLAAPVFGPQRDVVGSISICGPIARFTDDRVERFVPMLKATAAEISRLLQEH
jgi:DNA-binding IclR family transcriptional regulator